MVVSHPRLVCIISIYIAEHPIIEVNRGNNISLDFNSQVINLVSEKYLHGEEKYAYNITCSLSPDDHSETPQQMIIAIHEFAPFANSENYCMFVDSVESPVKCSGSKAFLTSQGPFMSSTGWKFRMTLNKSTVNIPKIRFWIAITSEYLKYTP